MVLDIEADPFDVVDLPEEPAPEPAATPSGAIMGAASQGTGAGQGIPAKEGTIAPDRRIFGRFELLIEMGHGGMATLYLARIQGPSNFEKLLAIKKIHAHLAAEDAFVRMFMDEARLAAKIHHPNVATTFDMGRIENSYFIAMEYVHGQNLTDVLKATVRDHPRFPWPIAARIVSDTAAGLHSAHELKNVDGKLLGVVHRDVSPQNILISYDGIVKVVDFGVAFAAEKLEQTSAGTIKGKASYMSPEQACGLPIDRRTDVFALGIILWESVCFQRLFRQETEGATLLKVRNADVAAPRSINPEVPADLEKVILKALAKEPDDRYRTAEELSEAIEQVLVAHGQVVASKHVAKMLDGLFHDRKELKDQQIKEALANATVMPLKGVGMRGSDTMSMARISEASLSAAAQLPPPKSRLWLWALATVGVALAAAALAIVLVRPFGGDRGADRGDAPRSAHAQAARQDAGAPMEPERRVEQPPMVELPSRVKIKITVTPALPGVEVTFRGQTHKGPVFEMVVPRSDKAESIGISAPDHNAQTVVIVPSADTEIPVKLAEIPRPVAPMYRPVPGMRPMQPGLWGID